MLCGSLNSNGIYYERVATRTLGSNPLAIGNAYAANSACDTPLVFAEAMIFDTALEEAAIKAVYRRSKARMLAKGITI